MTPAARPASSSTRRRPASKGSAKETWTHAAREVGVEGVGPAPGAVDELVDHHEVARMDVGLQRADRAGRQQGADTQLLHRPDVGPVGDGVGCQLVVAAVAGQEGDPPARHRPDRDRRRRGAVRGVELDRLDVVEEGVEARAAEHPDLGGAHAGLLMPAGAELGAQWPWLWLPWAWECPWPLELAFEPDAPDDEPESDLVPDFESVLVSVLAPDDSLPDEPLAVDSLDEPEPELTTRTSSCPGCRSCRSRCP